MSISISISISIRINYGCLGVDVSLMVMGDASEITGYVIEEDQSFLMHHST